MISDKSKNLYLYITTCAAPTGNNESHNSAIKNSQQFKINCAIEINDSFHDRMYEREGIRKSTSKYFNAFKFLDKSLVFITC